MGYQQLVVALFAWVVVVVVVLMGKLSSSMTMGR